MEQLSIIQQIDQFAYNHPQKVVYQDHEKSYTYQQLKEASDKIASYL